MFFFLIQVFGAVVVVCHDAYNRTCMWRTHRLRISNQTIVLINPTEGSSSNSLLAEYVCIPAVLLVM